MRVRSSSRLAAWIGAAARDERWRRRGTGVHLGCLLRYGLDRMDTVGGHLYDSFELYSFLMPRFGALLRGEMSGSR